MNILSVSIVYTGRRKSEHNEEACRKVCNQFATGNVNDIDQYEGFLKCSCQIDGKDSIKVYKLIICK